MGTVGLGRLAVIVGTSAAVVCGGCSRQPKLVKLSKHWSVEEQPAGRPTTQLYHTPGAEPETDAADPPALVDRAVERYRVVGGFCVVYVAARPEGNVLFVAAGRFTPIAVAKNDSLHPWRLDAKAIRRFEGPVQDAEGRTVLKMQQIATGDLCYAAQLTGRRQKDWAQSAHIDPSRFKVEESVIDVYGADSVGNTVLSDVAQDGEVELLDELIRAGADVNAANRGGTSVLMSAIVINNGETIRRLIRAGALVDMQDERGMTALMRAAQYGNLEAGKILLESGASAHVRDEYGMTALAHATESDRPEARELRTLLERAEGAAKQR